MNVYGLSGKSGTGKSYQALNVCRAKRIEYIVDDGLLITGNSVVAGRSAKRQATMIGAIKTALFTDDEHRAEVSGVIRARQPQSILILGTSDQMIHTIVKKLDLPPVTEMIQIEDITNQKERDVARAQRKQHGKHVIPAATFQLKHQFSGYFLNPLKIFQHKMDPGGGRETYERSVVRPTYSYLGGYTISEKVIADIIHAVGKSRPKIRAISKIVTTNFHEGIRISADILMQAGCQVPDEARQFQEEIVREIEDMTSFNVLFVTLTVKGLVLEPVQSQETI